MLDTIICGHNVDVLAGLKPASIDLTVTSPPYDDLRRYTGYTFDFEGVAQQLYRVMKPGGVVVWVVADATVDGSETGTSFRQALYFMGLGFNLHDTMIYKALGTGAKGSNYAYWQTFEYMFVFSKGRPATVNRLADKRNGRAGAVVNRGRLSASGEIKDTNIRVVPEYAVRENIWEYQPSNGNDEADHPAKFPEALAQDHILSWSNPGDLVLDPFVGSGTTCKMAIKHHRHYIGIDVSPEYCDLARRRIATVQQTLFEVAL